MRQLADENKRNENEDIQKGLEDFIDRQLNLDLSLAGIDDKKKSASERVDSDRELVRKEQPEIIEIGNATRVKSESLKRDMGSASERKPVKETGQAHKKTPQLDIIGLDETHKHAGKRIYDDMLVSSESYFREEREYEEERRAKKRAAQEEKHRREEQEARRRRRDEYEEDRRERHRRDEYEEDRRERRRRDEYEEDRRRRRYRDEYDEDDYDDDYDDEDDRWERRERRRREERSSGRNRKQSKKDMVKKKKKSKKNSKKNNNRGAKAFLVFVAILFVLIFGGIYMAVGHVYQKMTYTEAEGMTGKGYKDDGVINVLLIGNDSRLGADDGRSDAMILVSISDKTKTVTMTSFLRDMYVEIPGHDGNRLNAAYAYGGPQLLMETIEYNFDIPVHRYALVNFEAFANLVDAVNGIDLDVTNEEVKLINGYLMEYNQLLGRDLTYDWLDENASGVIHLNGPQALAYTRNRYIGTDFGRTERQRKVLAEVFKKLPGAMMTNGNGVIDGLFPNLTTNLKQRECYSIALSGWKVVGYDMVQQCVPLEGTYSNATIRSMAVLQVDFDANKKFLQETLYGR